LVTSGMQAALALLLLVSKKESIVKQSPLWLCLTSTDHSLIKNLNPFKNPLMQRLKKRPVSSVLRR